MDSDVSDEEFLSADEGEDEDVSVVTAQVEDVVVDEAEKEVCSIDNIKQESEILRRGEDNQEEQHGNIVAVTEDEKWGNGISVEENTCDRDESAEISIQHGIDMKNLTDVTVSESVKYQSDKFVTEMIQQVPTKVEPVSPTDEEVCEIDVGIQDQVVSQVAVKEVVSEQITDVPSRPSGSENKGITTIVSVTAKHDGIVEDHSNISVNVGNPVGFRNEYISMDKRNIDAKNNSVGMSYDNFEKDTTVNNKVINLEMVNQDLSTQVPTKSYPKEAAVKCADKTSPSDHPVKVNECMVNSNKPGDCAVVEYERDKYTDKCTGVAGGEQNDAPNRVMKGGSETNECIEECTADSADLKCAESTDEPWDWVDNTETVAAESHANHLKGENCSTTIQDSGVLVNDTSKPSSNVKPEDPVSTNGRNNTISKVKATDDLWGWDSWADTLISQATSKVSTLMETVEEQLGIPDPSIVAQKLKGGREKEKEGRSVNLIGEDQPQEENQGEGQDNVGSFSSSSSWFSSYIPVASTLTNLVQNKGQELVTGGIDALEYIGKSTVNYLSEGDPGLRNTRKSLMRRNKGETLSQVLQHAKLKADERQLSDSPPQGEDPKKLGDMLEKFQGIAHLDALQMLSSTCETKLLRISKVQSDEAREDCFILTSEIQQNFELTEKELDNETDFKKYVFAANKSLKMKVTCSKLLNAWSKLKKKTENLDSNNSDECFEICISSLAEFVSRCVEYYRKVADMLIMTDIEAKEMSVKRAKVLKSLSEMFRSEASIIANSFADHLASNKEDKIVSDFITDIYLENENCSSLLSDSHNLLLPILQWSGIQ